MFTSRLAYWLRLMAGYLGILNSCLDLIDAGNRFVLALRKSATAYRRIELPARKPRARICWTPLRQILKLLWRLGYLAGSEHEKFKEELEKTYTDLTNKSSQSPPRPPTLLKKATALEVQAVCICHTFTELFRFCPGPQEAKRLAHYPRSSDALLDFLDFCRTHRQNDSREALIVALPVFTEMLKPLCLAKRHPKLGEIANTKLRGFDRERFKVKIFRPILMLTRMYWGKLPKAEDATARAPAWSQPSLIWYYESIHDLCGDTLRGMLVMEIHLHFFALLIDTLLQLTKRSEPPVNEKEALRILEETLSGYRQIIARKMGRKDLTMRPHIKLER